MRYLKKKAEMGVGTLIIFIALLLVAAVAAGVIIQSAISMQEKALTTSDQAKGQIATYVSSVAIYGLDGRDRNIEWFEQIMKLAPGSDPIKLEDSLVIITLHDSSATLHYRGVGNTYDLSTTGYMTNQIEELGALSNETAYELQNNDLDDDGLVDSVYVSHTGVITFNLSSGVEFTVDGIDCSPASADITGTYAVNNGYIRTVEASGICGNNSVDEGVITITPTNRGRGYFAVEYLQTGPNHIEGTLQHGDQVQLYMQPPRDIGENENVRITFIPKLGTPTYIEFTTPDVIATERVSLR